MKIINKYQQELKYRFDSLRFFVRSNFTKNLLSKLSFKNDPIYLSEKQDKILNSIKKTKAVVSAEEHNFHGGLGETVSRILSQNYPAPQEFVATNDTFGESGKPAELMNKYGLNKESIIDSCEKVIKRK